MSYVSSEYVQCETIQSMLNDQFALCPIIDSMPTLEAILSTQQANGISQSVSDGSGKVKTIKVTYENRLLESDVTEGSGARACSTALQTFDNYTTYEIDPTVWLRSAEKFDVVDLATVCTSDVQGMIAKKIGKVVDALERKIATKTAEELVMLSGGWGSPVTVNGSDEFEVATLVSSATKVLDPFSWVNVDLALKQTGYCASPIIVGKTEFYKSTKAFENGCCSETGVDINAITNQFGKAVMYDKRIVTALGSSEDKSIVFQSGAVALIHYNESPQVPNLGANYAKFRVSSPRTGIPIDIVMQDDCGSISILGFANTKLVGLPTDMFAVGDEFRDVTFVNKIKVVNPA